MLNKISRLTRDKEFEAVFKKGKGGYNSLFSLKSMANGLPYNRYGIVVSLKVHKRATERNKIKRRVREAVKFFDKMVKINQDMVIVCRPAAVGAPLKEIKASLGLTLYRLKLINVNSSL